MEWTFRYPIHTSPALRLYLDYNSDKQIQMRIAHNFNRGLITPNGCLIGKVPFKYQIMTIGEIPPKIKNPGLLIRGWPYCGCEWESRQLQHPIAS